MTMQRRPLRDSGIHASVVGLGGNNFSRPGTATQTAEGADEVVTAALEVGVTFLDTADIYGDRFGGSEALLGEVIGDRRDEFVIATKFGHTGLPTELDELGAKGSRAYLRAAVEGSLTRLRTDRIDLYQQHTPDPATPIDETVAALGELIAEGRILAWGHSNFDAAQIAAADDAADRLGVPRPVTAQNEYSLLARGIEQDALPAIERAGLGLLPFFPLANGLLTGKYTREGGATDTRITRQKPEILKTAPWDALEAYRAFCDARGISMLQATFGWLLAHGAVASVIAGATRAEQVRANAAAGVGWRPTAAELEELAGLFPPA